MKKKKKKRKKEKKKEKKKKKKKKEKKEKKKKAPTIRYCLPKYLIGVYFISIKKRYKMHFTGIS